jgi:hypothetical protein
MIALLAIAQAAASPCGAACNLTSAQQPTAGICCRWQFANVTDVTWTDVLNDTRTLDSALRSLTRCHAATARTPDSGYVPYSRWANCNLECVPALAIVFAVIWLFFLFSVLATTADVYMVPVLERLAEQLRLSPNVAGVTILAFGNGGPEFFTLFAAFSAGNGAVAIGSLLGGGMFITTVVLGTVCLIAPFRPHRRPLLRDVAFYLAGVITVWYAARDDKITLQEALTMAVLCTFAGAQTLIVDTCSEGPAFASLVRQTPSTSPW